MAVCRPFAKNSGRTRCKCRAELHAFRPDISEFAFPRSTLIQGAILCAICLLATLAWRRLTSKVSAIRLETNGEISLLYPVDQTFVLAKILPGATVHPWLTVVRLKTDEKPPWALMLTVDSLKAVDFRRLRVFLRWRADFNRLNDDV